MLELDVVAAVRLGDVPGVRDELRVVVLPFFLRLINGGSEICRDPRWHLAVRDQRLQGLLDGVVGREQHQGHGAQWRSGAAARSWSKLRS
jgi:hypothetical protein